MAVEFIVHGFCQFLRWSVPDIQVGAYDLDRDLAGVYHCLRRGHGVALHPAAVAAAVPRAVFSVVPVFGDFGVFGHDDIAGRGHLVAAGDLAGIGPNHLFHLQPV